MHADDVLGVKPADFRRDHRTGVVADGSVALIAEAAHEFDPRRGDPIDVPAGLAGRAGEAVPGTFIPTDDLMADSVRAEDLNTRLIRRTKAEGGLRADVEVDDLSLILEQVASLRLGDERRTRQLRRRYLALFLAGLREVGPPLPGPAPAPMELASRWSPRDLR